MTPDSMEVQQLKLKLKHARAAQRAADTALHKILGNCNEAERSEVVTPYYVLRVIEIAKEGRNEGFKAKARLINDLQDLADGTTQAGDLRDFDGGRQQDKKEEGGP